jgi:hypothetical protein
MEVTQCTSNDLARCITFGVSHHDCFKFASEGVQIMLLSDLSK